MSIASIRKRASGATPGPWKRTGTAAGPHWYVAAPDCLVHGPALIKAHDTVRETTDRWIADAAFIAHARQDIPALLAVAEAAAALSRDNEGDDMCCEAAAGSRGQEHIGCRWQTIRDALAALEAQK